MSVCPGDILPSDSPVLREMLLEELASDEEQLEQTLAMMQSQRSDLRQPIETYIQILSAVKFIIIIFRDRGISEAYGPSALFTPWPGKSVSVDDV